MSDNVVALKAETHHHQLILEGFPEIKSTLFDLNGTKKMPLGDKQVGFGVHVSGRFEGVVEGHHVIPRGGETVEVWSITVLEAELD